MPSTAAFPTRPPLRSAPLTRADRPEVTWFGLARRDWLAGAALVLLVAATFAVALRGGFLWDDDLHVTANPTIIGPLGLREIWTSARANYFPLVLSSFWLQHALWGLAPFGYHAVTLGCHALAAVLLWRVLRALGVRGAWIGAALWAVHPVQAESVAWISELKNTQSAVFFLLSILFFLRFLASPAGTRAARWAFALAFAAGLAALLSKSSTVMLPVVLVLCAWWRGRRINRRHCAALAPFLVLSAVAAGWTIWEQKFHSGALGPEWSHSLAERAAIAGYVVWFYVGKLLWPAALSFIYPRWNLAASLPLALVPAVAVVVGIMVLWRRRRHPGARAGLFAAAYFVALLFPVLGFFDVYFFRYSFVGDHLQYLAGIGPLALLGAALASVFPRRATVVAVPVMAALALVTARQCRDYRDAETLWRATLARNPSATMAWVNLADTLRQAQRYDEAIRCFTRALALKPGMADAHNDLGGTLVLANRPAEALPHFARAVALQPGNADAHHNFGDALRRVGRLDEAIAQHRAALALDPRLATAQAALGEELVEVGRPAEALSHLQRALELSPEDGALHGALGRALAALGRDGDAMAEFRRAVTLAPRSAEAHGNLGTALARARQLEPAVREFEAAVALAPDSPAFRSHLGVALAALGRWSDAAAQFEVAVRLAPLSAEAEAQLAVALVNSGRLEASVPHFEASLRLHPGVAVVRRNFAQVLRSLGRTHEALEQFEAMERLEP